MCISDSSPVRYASSSWSCLFGCLIVGSLCGVTILKVGGIKLDSYNWNAATEDFKRLVTNEIFVDKSLFINDTLKCDEKVLQITRPRKWGKTLNLNMLKRFFEIELDRDGNPLPMEKRENPVLFKGGEIETGGSTKKLKPLKVSNLSDVMSHMGAHPVIYLSLRGVKGRNYVQFEEKIKDKVIDLFLSFPFIKDFMNDDGDILNMEEKIKLAQFITGKLEDDNFISSFEFLSMLLYKRFKSEVCIFIDDYDYPIINAFLQFGDKNRDFDSIVVMLRVLLENTFKENMYLLKGIITGTLNFFVVSSGISEYHFVGFNTLLDKPFSNFYGFNQIEVDELSQSADVYFNSTELQQWYGGFHIHGEVKYNPWSIMKCIYLGGKFDNYLQKAYSTDFTHMLDRAFVRDDMQEYFHLLLEGKVVLRSRLEESVYLRSVSGDFYSIFVHAGYLEPIPSARLTDKPIWRVRISNLDVRGIFATGVGKWVAQVLKLTDAEFEKFINLLISTQTDRFFNELEQMLTSNNCDDKTKDGYYHNLMGGIVYSLGLKYLVEFVKEPDQKKGGALLIPFKKYSEIAINLEYCVSESVGNLETVAGDHLKVLLVKSRPFNLKTQEYSYVKKVLHVSITFSGPKVFAKHKLVQF